MDPTMTADASAQVTTTTAAEQQEEDRAVWSAGFINDLPDSSFAVIESGGSKDETGRTKPRSLRHLPFKDGSGKIDLPHLRNALSRLSQTKIADALKAKARRILIAAAKKAGIKVDDSSEERSVHIILAALMGVEELRAGDASNCCHLGTACPGAPTCDCDASCGCMSSAETEHSRMTKQTTADETAPSTSITAEEAAPEVVTRAATAATAATAASDPALTPDLAAALFYAPITRIAKEKREIEGVMSSENVDEHGTVFDYDAMKRAAQAWAGNIREQHDFRKAVGRRVELKFDDDAHKVWLRAKISTGADDTWAKICDGTLTGFSIGAYDAKAEQRRVGDKLVPWYTDFKLGEVSVVDVPSNPDAREGLTIFRAVLDSADAETACVADELLDLDESAAPESEAETIVAERAAEAATAEASVPAVVGSVEPEVAETLAAVEKVVTDNGGTEQRAADTMSAYEAGARGVPYTPRGQRSSSARLDQAVTSGSDALAAKLAAAISKVGGADAAAEFASTIQAPAAMPARSQFVQAAQRRAPGRSGSASAPSSAMPVALPEETEEDLMRLAAMEERMGLAGEQSQPQVIAEPATAAVYQQPTTAQLAATMRVPVAEPALTRATAPSAADQTAASEKAAAVVASDPALSEAPPTDAELRAAQMILADRKKVADAAAAAAQQQKRADLATATGDPALAGEGHAHDQHAHAHGSDYGDMHQHDHTHLHADGTSHDHPHMHAHSHHDHYQLGASQHDHPHTHMHDHEHYYRTLADGTQEFGFKRSAPDLSVTQEVYPGTVVQATVASETSATSESRPVAERAASHGAFKGSHKHAHSAMNAQGDDDEHEHEHAHDDDASHDHAHADRAAAAESASAASETPAAVAVEAAAAGSESSAAVAVAVAVAEQTPAFTPPEFVAETLRAVQAVLAATLGAGVTAAAAAAQQQALEAVSANEGTGESESADRAGKRISAATRAGIHAARDAILRTCNCGDCQDMLADEDGDGDADEGGPNDFDMDDATNPQGNLARSHSYVPAQSRALRRYIRLAVQQTIESQLVPQLATLARLEARLSAATTRMLSFDETLLTRATASASMAVAAEQQSPDLSAPIATLTTEVATIHNQLDESRAVWTAVQGLVEKIAAQPQSGGPVVRVDKNMATSEGNVYDASAPRDMQQAGLTPDVKRAIATLRDAGVLSQEAQIAAAANLFGQMYGPSR